ncbi:hypothetical protein ABZ714_27880 [Streptomyces sp. NPDC006798]|uniref:hypothetical protein n=1 Tax=Streptomyces sp. NPDC006798 TaxID=3155462 RepID=UPI0033E42A46
MVYPADGGGGGRARGDFEKGYLALTTFQKRVNTLLATFNGSAAGKSKVSEQTVNRGSLSGPGGAFAEADGLFNQYNRVHQALISLSRSLGDQIEALNIAVYSADVGTDNVDEERRVRFAQIQARLDQQRAAERERERPKTDAPANTNDKSAGTEWR